MKYILPLILILSGCGWLKPGFINENTIPVEEKTTDEKVNGVDGPTSGHFDEEGNWIPDNPAIEWTYRIPDISAGFAFDFQSIKLTPFLSIELCEFNTHIPYLDTIKFDAGVGYQRAFIYVGKLWTNIFEISTGGFIGWNWEDNELSYGVGATVIKF